MRSKRFGVGTLFLRPPDRQPQDPEHAYSQYAAAQSRAKRLIGVPSRPPAVEEFEAPAAGTLPLDIVTLPRGIGLIGLGPRRGHEPPGGFFI